MISAVYLSALHCPGFFSPTSSPEVTRVMATQSTPNTSGAAPTAAPSPIISSADLLTRSRQWLAQAGQASLWWNTHFMRRAVTLLVGESSAGKTVFTHNLG